MSINRIENYLGFPGGVTGTRLAKLAVRQLHALKVDLRPTVKAARIEVDPQNDSRYIIRVEGAAGADRVRAGMVLLACGQVYKTLKDPDDPSRDLEIPPGLDIRYVMEAHMARQVRGKEILIFGGGDTAGTAALLYNVSGASVRLVAKELENMSHGVRQELRKERIPIESPRDVVDFFDDRGRVGVTVRNLETGEEEPVAVDRVHVLIGANPNTELLDNSPEVRVALNEKDRSVLTDAHVKDDPRDPLLPFCASRDGIFAAGDVRVLARRRVGQAVGQGAAAVASMERYLREQDKRKDGYVWQHVLSDDEDRQSLWRTWQGVIPTEAAQKDC